MQSNKVKLEKREFLITEPSIQDFQVTCWQRPQDLYIIHAFSAVYETAEQLINNYENVRDYIAMFFQSNTLELDIERWNMYEFIFLKEVLVEEYKQKIEQDKFSTRKFVIDAVKEDISEEFIQSVIIEELFTFEVQKRMIANVDIYSHLQQVHSEVMNFLEKDDSDDNAQLTKTLIKVLGHGKD